MAYSITTTSKFLPFSYERYLQPYAENEKDFREILDKAGDLEVEASKWENKINKDTDKKTAALYLRYADDLRASADKLYKEGLTATSRSDLIRMKRRYALEITPIEEAYNARAAEVKRQQELQDKSGGKTIFTRDARTTSLDDYYGNNLEDFKSINLNDVMNEAVLAGQSLSKRYFSGPEGTLDKKNGYINYVTTLGLSPAQALLATAGDNAYPEFLKFKEAIEGKYGKSGYSGIDLQAFDNAVLQGLNTGIVYDVKNSLLADWKQKAAVDYSYDIAKIDHQAKLAENAAVTAQENKIAQIRELNKGKKKTTLSTGQSAKSTIADAPFTFNTKKGTLKQHNSSYWTTTEGNNDAGKNYSYKFWSDSKAANKHTSDGKIILQGRDLAIVNALKRKHTGITTDDAMKLLPYYTATFNTSDASDDMEVTLTPMGKLVTLNNEESSESSISYETTSEIMNTEE